MVVHHRRVDNPFARGERRTVGYSDYRYNKNGQAGHGTRTAYPKACVFGLLLVAALLYTTVLAPASNDSYGVGRTDIDTIASLNKNANAGRTRLQETPAADALRAASDPGRQTDAYDPQVGIDGHSNDQKYPSASDEQELFPDESMDELGDEPVDGSGDEPVDKSEDEPVDKSEDEPVDESADKSEDEPIDEPVDKSEDEPMDEPADKSGDEPVDKSEDEPVDEPADKSEDEPVDKSEDEPVDKSEDEPVDEPADKSGDEPVDKSGDEPVDKSGDVPVDKSGDEPVDEPVDKSEDEPVNEPIDAYGPKKDDSSPPEKQEPEPPVENTVVSEDHPQPVSEVKPPLGSSADSLAANMERPPVQMEDSGNTQSSTTTTTTTSTAPAEVMDGMNPHQALQEPHKSAADPEPDTPVASSKKSGGGSRTHKDVVVVDDPTAPPMQSAGDDNALDAAVAAAGLAHAVDKEQSAPKPETGKSVADTDFGSPTDAPKQASHDNANSKSLQDSALGSVEASKIKKMNVTDASGTSNVTAHDKKPVSPSLEDGEAVSPVAANTTGVSVNASNTVAVPKSANDSISKIESTNGKKRDQVVAVESEDEDHADTVARSKVTGNDSADPPKSGGNKDTGVEASGKHEPESVDSAAEMKTEPNKKTGDDEANGKGSRISSANNADDKTDQADKPTDGHKIKGDDKRKGSDKVAKDEGVGGEDDQGGDAKNLDKKETKDGSKKEDKEASKHSTVDDDEAAVKSDQEKADGREKSKVDSAEEKKNPKSRLRGSKANDDEAAKQKR